LEAEVEVRVQALEVGMGVEEMALEAKAGVLDLGRISDVLADP
jgi:hypothetical protein